MAIRPGIFLRVFPAELPQLESPRLLLRGLSLSDAEAFQVICDDPDLAKATGMIPSPYPPGEAARWITEQQELQALGEHVIFVITLKEAGDVIGNLSFKGSDAHSKAEIGYIIGKRWWGNGYATEALTLAIQWGFEKTILRRMYAYCFSWNDASVRVLEKAGFQREGLLRENFYANGTFESEIVMGLTRTDWENQIEEHHK